MIFGAHVILQSRDAEADRAFLAQLLGAAGIDAGEGWLIFPLPASEVAVHPADGPLSHELYLMCDDLTAEISRIRGLGVEVGDVHHAPWGSVTQIALAGGGTLGLYQPRHPLAISRPG